MQASPYAEFQMNSLDTWYNYAPGLHGVYTYKNYFYLKFSCIWPSGTRSDNHWGEGVG